MLLRHVLLGEFCQLHQLRDQLLGVVAVGAVHQRRSHRIQDSLVTHLHRNKSSCEGEENMAGKHVPRLQATTLAVLAEVPIGFSPGQGKMEVYGQTGCGLIRCCLNLDAFGFCAGTPTDRIGKSNLPHSWEKTRMRTSLRCLNCTG